ncbi:MAG: hypothetical protein ACI4KH_06265 [Oscillospiraceae bacterium]
MKEKDKLFFDDRDEHSGCIPDEIKIHTDERTKYVPDKIKTLPEENAGCHIAPEIRQSEADNDIGFNGTIHNRGEKIRIAPNKKKTNGKIFT